MKESIDTLIVFSCDQAYFPLAKGLVLSILEPGGLPPGVGLAFIDIGCEAGALRWLESAGVRVRALDERTVGRLADPHLGYRRAQACRPFLPQLFPEANVLIWMDSDMWVQDGSIFGYLHRAANAHPDKVFITPECHYSYTLINDNAADRQREMQGYYEPLFGKEVAARLRGRPTLNSGFFAMAASHWIWSEWARLLKRIFLEEYDLHERLVLHMADQIALNALANGTADVMLLDPLYNYISLWTPPIRGEGGLARVALPPHVPIGIVHLAGGLKHFGKRYFSDGLFYKEGAYLTEAERDNLFSERNAGGYGQSAGAGIERVRQAARCS